MVVLLIIFVRCPHPSKLSHTFHFSCLPKNHLVLVFSSSYWAYYSCYFHYHLAYASLSCHYFPVVAATCQYYSSHYFLAGDVRLDFCLTLISLNSCRADSIKELSIWRPVP